MDLLSSFEFGSLIISFLCIVLGLFVGMLMGALPGLGLMIAITLLLPLSYNLSVMDSILLLLACYQGAEYGGSISAITLGIPGTAMASATVMDGHALAKNKSPGKALGYSITASTIGALFGGLVLILLSKPLSSFALQLGDPEYFLLGILGLVAVSTIGSGDKVKNLISIVLGLIAGTIGMDIFTGYPRFTGNIHDLSEGINLIALVVALFAFTEVFYMVSGNLNHRNKIDASNLKTKLTFKELRAVMKSTWLGSMIGSFVGILPGVGSSASGWFGYILAKKVSKDPSSFGKGSPEGIAAPESANNATVGGALLPLLTLGIPGSASLAIIAGAFIIHGIQPGPQIFTKSPELVNGIFVGFMVTAIIMYFMGRMMTTGFARILVTPNSFLVPSIVIFSVVGIYAASSSHFNLWFALILGIVAFYCRVLNYSIYSFVLAFVLSPIIEVGLRRSLVISNGSYSIFFTRTYSIILIVTMASFVIFAIYKWIKAIKNNKEEKDNNIKM